MIRTETFRESSLFTPQYKEVTMKKLNEFIEKNKIERSDILEFRTDEVHGTWVSFKVIISWWE